MAVAHSDTICAIATATGRAGVGIVRVSGPDVPALASQLIGQLPAPRYATLTPFLEADGSIIDTGLALFFAAPHSFTGEHVLELHGHGGPVVLNSVLDRLQQLGARLARPGEFSERAYLNNKIDLVQAEAIADLIAANSQQAARSALKTLQGDFSRHIDTLLQSLIHLRVQIEAAIDFADEDIEVFNRDRVASVLDETLAQLADTWQKAQQGALLKEGMTVVLAGQPNAGKSSLLNALSGQDAAIVTDIPGTTRDTLDREISLGGLPVRLIDTAGLRSTQDPVESEGVRRARQAIQSADCILLLIDASALALDLKAQLGSLLSEGEDASCLAEPSLLSRLTLVHNKIDLLSEETVRNSSTDYQGHALPTLWLSVKTRTGIELLIHHLQSLAGFSQSNEGVFAARKRHLVALETAQQHLQHARGGLSDHLQLELIAEDLRLAQRELGAITGEFSSDDLLGEIFSSFCIGK